jgi:DNA-binding MarR family transcriptional regulator
MSTRIKPSVDQNPQAQPAGAALRSRPGFLARRLHQIHGAMFAKECGSFNITPVQHGLMTILLEQPGLDQISLGSELGIDRTNVADVLMRLEDRGLVRRQVSRADRRMKLASLTDEGETLTRQMETHMKRAQDRLMAPLGEVDRAAFLELLGRLVDTNNEWSRAPLRMD